MVLPVEVLTVQAEPLALSSELPGRIEPVRVAEVRARVAGIVVRKRFEEGPAVPDRSGTAEGCGVARRG